MQRIIMWPRFSRWVTVDSILGREAGSTLRPTRTSDASHFQSNLCERNRDISYDKGSAAWQLAGESGPTRATK